jgi:thiol-disulfide isomerase/thioredoxin
VTGYREVDPAAGPSSESAQDGDHVGGRFSRRGYLIGAASVALVGSAAVVTQQRLNRAGDGGAQVVAGSGRVGAAPSVGSVTLPVGGQAPAVQPAGWLNTPQSPASLAGKVVLYYFWTFECINCQHVQPHVKAWHARYAADGLVVLSIHTPEFEVEADPANVAEYVRAQEIRYPVALDPQSRVWRAFGNRFWPAFYLHDRQGRRRLTHFGEGSYGDIESAIRQLLGVGPGAPRAVEP